MAAPAVGLSQNAASPLQGDSCHANAPHPENPTAAGVRIGTFNIRADKSVADFTAGVRALLPHVDIAGLQEINSKEKAASLAKLTGSGWDFYRQYRTNIPSHPTEGGTEQQPLLWRSDRFVCTYAGPALMSPLYSLHGEKPTYDDSMRHWFTVVHLVDRVTGQHLALINCHLIQGVVKAGRPVPGIPRHWHLYVNQLTHVVAEAQRQQGYGTVFVMGDFNSGWLQDKRVHHAHLPIRQFRHIGFRSMWATDTPANGMGTHSNALIDQVWSVRAAKRATVLFSMRGYSVPAVARYRLSPAS
jgi:hypothetical protein